MGVDIVMLLGARARLVAEISNFRDLPLCKYTPRYITTPHHSTELPQRLIGITVTLLMLPKKYQMQYSVTSEH